MTFYSQNELISLCVDVNQFDEGATGDNIRKCIETV